MIAQGFKPVGWVAGVAAAALGCYMLSLQVASERSDLARVERQIVAAQQEIRSLQTELGTRGRLSQLERWNAEVLALSAPAAGQFLESEVRLARFDVREQTLADRARVQLASAETAPASPVRPPVQQAVAEVKEEAPAQPLVRRASLQVGDTTQPQVRRASAPSGPASLLDDRAMRELGAAARAEQGDPGSGN